MRHNGRYADPLVMPRDEEEKEALEPRDTVRLMFELRDGWCERMWVKVTDVNARCVVSTLVNQPVGIRASTEATRSSSIGTTSSTSTGRPVPTDRHRPSPKTCLTPADRLTGLFGRRYGLKAPRPRHHRAEATDNILALRRGRNASATVAAEVGMRRAQRSWGCASEDGPR
jgi:hypothetical protein